METAEFVEQISTLLRDHGFAWVDESVRKAIEQGADVERKDASAVGLSKRFKEFGDPARQIADSENYLDAFETKPGRATATATREYTMDEVANLYLTAAYSIFIEPAELSDAGIELMGSDIGSITFAAEDGGEQFDVRKSSQEPSELAVSTKLRALLKDALVYAS